MFCFSSSRRDVELDCNTKSKPTIVAKMELGLTKKQPKQLFSTYEEEKSALVTLEEFEMQKMSLLNLAVKQSDANLTYQTNM